ncbi:hypothetical protein AAVH_21394 [Aphelenchoides avenae]|nr:hypothetical protein AAVH_21394 [Aphelenchus avenae]
MSDIEHLHHVLDTAKCVVSIVLNGMLGFLILKYSTGHLSAYKKVLGMTCLADILLSSAVLLSQPVIFYAPDGAMVLVSNGFFADRSAFVDHLVMSMWCMSVHSNVVCLVAQFLIRYRTMCKQNE